MQRNQKVLPKQMNGVTSLVSEGMFSYVWKANSTDPRFDYQGERERETEKLRQRERGRGRAGEGRQMKFKSQKDLLY